ncbi:hypothetical protein BGZ80_000463 [Entomortierella chlamydospora]|uniref:Peptidase s41 family protein n=1 Tax=Entomortierella chlamydospora TaxID=101097 RepID=A0A9P6SYZ6_9FUNG|nr:hypothetical protein BGZ80_000463 [Entomortierella chlamydospora]
MVSPSLRGLAASAYLIASIALSTAAPIRKKDACGILGATNATDITYDLVAACYKAIPFDSTIASETTGSVVDIFNDYYVFRDSALTPDLQMPFTSAPVDIVKVLETIGSTNYARDLDFHTDIALAIASLHDAHASYNVDCYSAYLFEQPLVLYAPVINGQQSVRVLNDFLGRDISDCEITTIDGNPALPHLQDFADSLSLSKDAGARLNAAIGSQVYDASKNDFVYNSGQFSQRAALPENPTITYELQCSNSASTMTIKDRWYVWPNTQVKFDSVHSYLKNVCKTTPPKNGTPSKRELSSPVKKRSTPAFKKSSFYDAASATIPPKRTSDLSNAEMLGAGNATAFYQLQNPSDVGVIVVHTMDVDYEWNELTFIADGLSEFNRRNISKIIFDFQNNGGGSVDFASTIVQLFFPNTGPLDKILPQDLRVDASIQAVSKRVFNTTGSLYDATNYVDFATKERYTSDGLFLNPVTITRNGRSTLFTEHTGISTTDLQDSAYTKFIQDFPWTNNAANIRILSDGRCGSSCALTTNYLHDLYDVSTYSIGGIRGEELSFFSFAGGAVSDLTTVIGVYNSGDVPSPLSPLPYNGDLRFPLVEVYARNSDVPLEYDYSKYPADTHLNFDSENARSRDVMWTQVAANAWS